MPAATEGDWARLAEETAAHHPLAATLHDRHGPPTGIRRTPPARRFASLAEAIAYQQLSGRAAATIWSRVCDAMGEPCSPEAVIAAGPESLRAAGLSNAKCRALADLAERVADGTVDLARTARLSDEEVVEHLCVVRGIGPWTAQMYLLFDLGRTDVWPTGDLGVRVGMAKATGRPAPMSTAELAEAGEPFSPHRSLLAWWCWREAETVTPGGDAGTPAGEAAS